MSEKNDYIVKKGNKFIIFEKTSFLSEANFLIFKNKIKELNEENSSTKFTNIAKDLHSFINNAPYASFPRSISTVFSAGISVGSKDYNDYLELSKEKIILITGDSYNSAKYHLEYCLQKLTIHERKTENLSRLNSLMEKFTDINTYNKKFKNLEIESFSEAASNNTFKNISIPNEMCTAYDITTGSWWIINKFKKNKGLLFATLASLKKQMINYNKDNVIVFQLTDKELKPIECGSSAACQQFYSDYEKNKLTFSLDKIFNQNISENSARKLKI